MLLQRYTLSHPRLATPSHIHSLQHPEAFTSLLGVYQAIGIMVVGAGIFATRVTERLLPVGSVDLIGSSHNIMHVMVVISHLVFMEAGQGLWLWRGSADGMCPARHH